MEVTKQEILSQLDETDSISVIRGHQCRSIIWETQTNSSLLRSPRSHQFLEMREMLELREEKKHGSVFKSWCGI